MVYRVCYRVYSTEYMVFGSFQTSGALIQGLQFWLLERALKVGLGTFGGIETVLVLTLIILK